MPCDAYGQTDEEDTETGVFGCKDCAIYQGYPHQGYGDDFCSSWNGTMFLEITDVGAQVFLLDEPFVEFGGAVQV